MAAAVIPYTSVTRVRSVPLTQAPDLLIVEFYIDQTFETGDWITSDELSVEGILGVLGVTVVDSSNDVVAGATSDVTLTLHQTAQIAAKAAGSSDIDAVTTKDTLTLGSNLNTDIGMWITLLVRS